MQCIWYSSTYCWSDYSRCWQRPQHQYYSWVLTLETDFLVTYSLLAVWHSELSKAASRGKGVCLHQTQIEIQSLTKNSWLLNWRSTFLVSCFPIGLVSTFLHFSSTASVDHGTRLWILLQQNGSPIPRSDRNSNRVRYTHFCRHRFPPRVSSMGKLSFCAQVKLEANNSIADQTRIWGKGSQHYLSSAR